MSSPGVERTLELALIPGDGIGPEVMDAAVAVLRALESHGSFRLSTTGFDWSCRHYLETGTMMPADGIEQLATHDAILLGAVGWPGVPDHVSLWGLLIPIRRAFDLYVNLRPMRSFPGVPTPLRDDLAAGIDMVMVRENSEGEYSDIGGMQYPGTAREAVVQQSLFSRIGIERIARFAVELSLGRRGGLVSATKSNGILHTMPYWDRVVQEIADDAGADVRHEHVDALAAKLVLDPRSYDVILASNLFGDILSDLAAAICGSIGIAPSANLDPGGGAPSLFEPVHGSAPDIAGRELANPVGMLWSTVLMLEHAGYPGEARALMTAVEASLADPSTRTRDVGGTARTAEVTEAVLARLDDAMAMTATSRHEVGS